MKFNFSYRLVLFLKLILCFTTIDVYGDQAPAPAPSASDGITIDQKDDKAVSLKITGPTISHDVTLDYSYVGDANFKSGGAGHVSEQTAQFGYRVGVPINKSLSLQGSIDYNRFDFGQPAGSPLPYDLQTLSVSLGARYQLSDKWAVYGAIIPRLELIENWDQIQSQDFQAGGVVGATYDPNPNLSLSFALIANPGSIGTPVLPILGVRWKFAELWTLNAGFPRTAIDYQLLPNLRISPIELSFSGGSFHTSKSYGDSVGMSQLNDRKLQYTEVRVGTGADYAITKNIHVDATAGAVVYRKFDFEDASFSPKVDPAPYVQVGIKVGF
jgi:opacity protein-like surface antigen